MVETGLKTRQARGNGGLRFRNGKYEGNYRLRRSDGTVLIKSFRRDTIEEICEIKARLKLLGRLPSNVVKVHIFKDSNEIRLTGRDIIYFDVDVKFDTKKEYIFL